MLIHTHTCPSRSAALHEAEFTVYTIPEVRAGLFSRPGARLSALRDWPTEALALAGSASGDDGFSGLSRVTLLQVVQWGLPPPRDADEVGAGRGGGGLAGRLHTTNVPPEVLIPAVVLPWLCAQFVKKVCEKQNKDANFYDSVAPFLERDTACHLVRSGCGCRVALSALGVGVVWHLVTVSRLLDNAPRSARSRWGETAF